MGGVNAFLEILVKRTEEPMFRRVESYENLIFCALHLRRDSNVAEHASEYRFVVERPFGSTAVLAYYRVDIAIHIIFVLEIARGAQEPDRFQHAFEVLRFEKEHNILLEQALPHPLRKLGHFFFGQVVHLFFRRRYEVRDDAVLGSEIVPLDVSSQGVVYKIVYADPLLESKLSEISVYFLVDSDGSRNRFPSSGDAVFSHEKNLHGMQCASTSQRPRAAFDQEPLRLLIRARACRI